jgi:hypothetical protein
MTHRIRPALFALPLACFALIAGCEADPASEPPVTGPAVPAIPSARWELDGRLALPADLPHADTPFPIERLAYRDGWSPVQSGVIRFDGSWPVDIDGASLNGVFDDGLDGAVQLWDLTEGRQLRCFAELDAWPELGDERPSLLVRPMEPATPGHRLAAALTDAVRLADGSPLPPPAWYAAALQGATVTGDPLPAGHDAEVQAQLAALGVSGAVFAWDWTVGHPTTVLDTLLTDAPVPSSWSLQPADEPEPPAEGPDWVWKQATGTFRARSWLTDGRAPDATFVLDDAGLPTAQGELDAYLLVHLPESVRGAAPGTVPVWIFGHGIFAQPLDYLGPDGPVAELADRAGAIVVATVWRGLTTTDLAVPVNVGADIGTFPLLTDKLAQGVANTLALIALVDEGGLLDDPIFEGLANPDALRYHGISLGGIEGATTLANTDRIPHGVLHVGGSTWSTMLERSKNWGSFEPLVEAAIDSPADRQLLYSLTQLFWDPVDPANHGHKLAGRSVLWQIALGDDQVPNLTSWTLARAAGASLLEPYGVAVPGLSAAPGPLAGPAVAQFDPETTDHEATNRPSPSTGAHDTPRGWEGSKRQTLRFLDAASPGVIEHFCGETPCSSTNPGDPEL